MSKEIIVDSLKAGYVLGTSVAAATVAGSVTTAVGYAVLPIKNNKIRMGVSFAAGLGVSNIVYDAALESGVNYIESLEESKELLIEAKEKCASALKKRKETLAEMREAYKAEKEKIEQHNVFEDAEESENEEENDG